MLKEKLGIEIRNIDCKTNDNGEIIYLDLTHHPIINVNVLASLDKLIEKNNLMILGYKLS